MQLRIQTENSEPEKENQRTIYEIVGGQETFFRLVTRFYSGVATDPVLRPMYPEDLTDSIKWTALFLIQFFGGPGEYSVHRGHPRLRMRHFPFKIGVTERDAWVYHMKNAVESEISDSTAKAFMLDYFERTATFLINQND